VVWSDSGQVAWFLPGGVDPAGTELLLNSGRQGQQSIHPQDGEWNLPGEVGSTGFSVSLGPVSQGLPPHGPTPPGEGLHGQDPPGLA